MQTPKTIEPIPTHLVPWAKLDECRKLLAHVLDNVEFIAYGDAGSLGLDYGAVELTPEEWELAREVVGR